MFKKTIVYLLLLITAVATSCGQANRKKKYAYTNALINESSPYLQQHAHSPVHWVPWSKKAFQTAKKENKIVFISIGYSSCHWCHVLARQVFSDTTVADYMNKHFVSILVDKEERPAINQIYVRAATMIRGSVGWPLNIFALPNGKPFVATTYLPKKRFFDLFQKVVRLDKNKPQALRERAEAITQGIRSQQLIQIPEDSTAQKRAKQYKSLYAHVDSSIDFHEGGLQGSSKFPMASFWEWMLQYHYLTGNEQALKAATTTLDHIAYGGIYDQLGCGFSRYTMDKRWRIPHFEKMLYTNAQLISIYSHAYQITHKPLYAGVIQESLKFIQRKMTAKNGGFYTSLNSESDEEEGKYYVWTQQEIENVLPTKSAELIKAYYEITPSGNWEKGKNILYRNPKVSDSAFAGQRDMPMTEWHKILQKAKDKLLKKRAERIPPSTDEKILTSWNALMLEAYLDAYRALGDKKYLNTALKNAHFLENKMIKDNGSLWHTSIAGKASVPGFLSDYSFLANAYIDLYQVTFDKHWLTRANEMTKYALAHFRDSKDGLFYGTSDLSDPLIARLKKIMGNPIPSSNSVMATVLYKLGIYFDDQTYMEDAEQMLSKVSGQIASSVPFLSNWAQLMGMMQKGPYEIAVMGENALAKAKTMQKNYLPTALFMGGQKENLPLLSNKRVADKTMIYVCKNKTCKLPVTAVSSAIAQIKNKNLFAK